MKATNTLLIVLFLTTTIVQFGKAQNWIQKGLDIDGETPYDESGFSVSLSSDGNTVAIGAPSNDDCGIDAGQVLLYSWNGSVWVQKGVDIYGEAAGDYAGWSVSLSSDGNTVAFGAPYNDGNGSASGHVKVFYWDGSAWVQKGLDINGEAIEDASGRSVSLSSDGNTIAIGAPFNDGNGITSGQTRIYSWDGTVWIQKGTDIDGEATANQSGYSVSLSSDGNTIAIGAPDNDNNGSASGNVQIYSWNGNSWEQKGSDINGEMANDFSGYSVDLNSDGTIVAIGAPWNCGSWNNAGHVRIYRWNSHMWVQQGIDIDGEALDDHFGYSVSLSSDGNTIAIGAPSNDGNEPDAGHTRVYSWNGSFWDQIGLDIDGEAAKDESGISVSLNSDGRSVAIGAHDNSDNGINSGQTRVYEYDVNIFVKVTDLPKIVVFPNPNNGIFSVMNLNNGAQIRIYNTVGEIVYQAEIIENNIKFDLLKFKKGTYLLYGISDQHVQVLEFIIE